jgi:hypothetical protein
MNRRKFLTGLGLLSVSAVATLVAGHGLARPWIAIGIPYSKRKSIST